MAENTFEFTDQMETTSNQLWAVTSAVGAGLCFLVLLVISIVSLHRPSRQHLDRVSFRILRYSLISNTFFGIANAAGGWFTGPTSACGFAIFILQLTLEFSSFLAFCIALNLQLVVVHNFDGRRAEKFYILISLLVSLGLTIPPYAAKQYGWDPLVKDCWYTNDNPKQRLNWQIGTQLFWTGLTVIGEVCSSLVVVIFLLRHQFRRRNIVRTINDSVIKSAPGAHGRIRASSTASVQDRHFDHVKMYKVVILRIALYPLASCIINLTSIMCVIHATVKDGVHNWTDYRILLLSDFLYGGRAVVYALLAATDPALVRAVRVFVQDLLGRPMHTSSMVRSSSSRTVSTSAPLDTMVAHIELSTICSPTDYDHDGAPTFHDKRVDVEHFGQSQDVLSIHGQKQDFTAAPVGPNHGSVSNLEAERLRHSIERQKRVEKEREVFQKQI